MESGQYENEPFESTQKASALVPLLPLKKKIEIAQGCCKELHSWVSISILGGKKADKLFLYLDFLLCVYGKKQTNKHTKNNSDLYSSWSSLLFSPTPRARSVPPPLEVLHASMSGFRRTFSFVDVAIEASK